MIVGEIAVEDRGGTVERSAVVHAAGRDHRVFVTAPADIAARNDDASGFFCMTLPLAMKLGEDLTLLGPVAPELLARTAELQTIYHAWLPGMQKIHVTAPAGASGPRADLAACYLSRGVDSVFASARDRARDRRFNAVVFVDGLEPRHNDVVRAEEERGARVVAQRLDLPCFTVQTNIRSLSDPIIEDWEDMCGAGLSFLAHGIAGGFGTVHIPASDTYLSVEPVGTSPLLDPLFSSGQMQIEHGSLAESRLDKVRWLAEQRPDLLDELKVCFYEDRSDNCGLCGKCLITMAELQVVGALEEATQFPPKLDLEAIAKMRMKMPKAMIDWAEFAALDDDGMDGTLSAAVRESLRASVRVQHDYRDERGSFWVEPRSARTHHLDLLLSLLVDGESYPPASPR